MIGTGRKLEILARFGLDNVRALAAVDLILKESEPMIISEILYELRTKQEELSFNLKDVEIQLQHFIEQNGRLTQKEMELLRNIIFQLKQTRSLL